MDNDIPRVAEALSHGADVNGTGKPLSVFTNGALHFLMSSTTSQTELLKFLLTVPGIDINKLGIFGDNAEGATPIMVACNYGRNALVKILLSLPGIDLKGTLSAAMNGIIPRVHPSPPINCELLTILLDAGADINDSYGTRTIIAPPIHAAIKTGAAHLEGVLDLLISKGADIEKINQFGQTPLQYAVKQKEYKVTTVLLNTGANIEAINEFTSETAILVH